MEKIKFFSCGHIIPPDNLLAMIINSGPSSQEFNFNYASRFQEKLMEELGRSLINLSNVVPEGIVVFFPSYSYEDKGMNLFVPIFVEILDNRFDVHSYVNLVVNFWKQKGIIDSIEKKKKVRFCLTLKLLEF